MENKLDQILDDLNEIKISQAVHTEQLKEYLRRHDSLDSEVAGIADSLEPIQRHVNGVQVWRRRWRFLRLLRLSEKVSV